MNAAYLAVAVHHFTSLAGAGPIVGPAIAIGFLSRKKNVSLLRSSLSDLFLLYDMISAGTVAVVSGLSPALMKGGGKGGMILWPLFGTAKMLLEIRVIVEAVLIRMNLRQKTGPVTY